jgi:virginiamycin B lyase
VIKRTISRSGPTAPYGSPPPTAIGRISPNTHSVTEYSDGGDPFNITSGPDGALWYTDDGYGRIGRIDPSTHLISHFAPKGKVITPAFIVARDSYLWFTDENGRIGRLSPSTHRFALYNVPTQGGRPYGIAVGKDDELWFAEQNESEIVKMCPELGPTECSTSGT